MEISPAQTLILDSSYSRQGNIYNGDTQNSNPRSALVNSLADSKAETARLYRSAYSLTHDGAWDWGDTKNVISYERTVNSHLLKVWPAVRKAAIQAWILFKAV